MEDMERLCAFLQNTQNEPVRERNESVCSLTTWKESVRLCRIGRMKVRAFTVRNKTVRIARYANLP